MNAGLRDLVSGVVAVTNTDGFPLESMPPQGSVTVEFGTGATVEIGANMDEFERAKNAVAGGRLLCGCEVTVKWKPIASAPIDGTVILACGMYEGREDLGVHPRAVRFKTYHPNAPGKGAWRNHLGHKEEWLTHWMPLPSPPKSA